MKCVCGRRLCRIYITPVLSGRQVFKGVGWLCEHCGKVVPDTRAIFELSGKRRPKRRCTCGAPMLRAYKRESYKVTVKFTRNGKEEVLKVRKNGEIVTEYILKQRFVPIGWLCLKCFSFSN